MGAGNDNGVGSIEGCHREVRVELEDFLIWLVLNHRLHFVDEDYVTIDGLIDEYMASKKMCELMCGEVEDDQVGENEV